MKEKMKETKKPKITDTLDFEINKIREFSEIVVDAFVTVQKILLNEHPFLHEEKVHEEKEDGFNFKFEFQQINTIQLIQIEFYLDKKFSSYKIWIFNNYKTKMEEIIEKRFPEIYSEIVSPKGKECRIAGEFHIPLSDELNTYLQELQEIGLTFNFKTMEFDKISEIKKS